MHKRIAICLSGQPRTMKYCVESIRSFFSANDDYTYDFFCQSWDYNTYKVKEEGKMTWVDVPAGTREEITNDIITLYNPKKILVQGVEVLQTRFYWDSILYSTMMANQLKIQYEIENDFRYDCVIKARYDLIFPPNSHFRIDKRPYVCDLDLFCSHADRMPTEFNIVNASDTIYYGSSLAMDVASDLYWYAKELFASPNSAHNCGPGTLMSLYTRTNNIRFMSTYTIPETIYRYSAIPLHWEKDYLKIAEKDKEIYT